MPWSQCTKRAKIAIFAYARGPRIFAYITSPAVGSELPTYLEATVVSALTAAHLKRLAEPKAKEIIGAEGFICLVSVNTDLLDVFLAAELELPDVIKMNGNRQCLLLEEGKASSWPCCTTQKLRFCLAWLEDWQSLSAVLLWAMDSEHLKKARPEQTAPWARKGFFNTTDLVNFLLSRKEACSNIL